jgi:hypothetical protein
MQDKTYLNKITKYSMYKILHASHAKFIVLQDLTKVDLNSGALQRI